MIRLGGADFGIASEISDDPLGSIWQLLRAMDGTRTIAQLHEHMTGVNPKVTERDIAEIIATLTERGFLRDAASAPSAGVFGPVEIRRYQRNFDFWSYFNTPGRTEFDVQRSLAESRVTVLGLGGLGSFAALSLAAIGVGSLRIVDFDRVEHSNLNRQILYVDSDIGQKKVAAARKRLRLINKHISIEALDIKVIGLGTALDCFRDCDLVVCAADRPRVQIYRWMNEAAVYTGVPWIRGANGGHTVNLFLHVPFETACFECEQMAARAINPHYDTVVNYAMTEIGDRTINPCTAPVAGLIGNLVALEAVKHLTKVAEPCIRGRAMTFDIRDLSSYFQQGERVAECSVCGERPSAQSSKSA
ncbi:MAG: HesA/MoeB/ThiF family protein [Angustibacter sp.]